MMKLLMTAACGALVWLGVSVNLVAAQGPDSQNQLVVSAGNNESAKAELDAVAAAASDGKPIFLIAHLGSEESSEKLSSRRLLTARSYLEGTRNIAKERIVTSQGARVKGPGKIEVYVNCRLFRVFVFGRNENFAKES